VSGLDENGMLEIFPERGGDPDRAGKKHPLDCLVWRAERPGEPAWDTGVPSIGRGRPGWHVECSAIALHHLGDTFDVQGGGSDLVFPHHEMSAGHAQVAHDGAPFARAYVHAGMVAYEGEKMSKSKGNLVLVSRLRADGVDPMAVRLAILGHHYRSDWEWTDDVLSAAQADLRLLRRAVAAPSAARATDAIALLRTSLAHDLDAPAAVAALLDWARATDQGGATDPSAGAVVAAVADACLGLSLT
jgi:L-cysteine:1D-myo-inositol 2-amino-2-deoxy-alpha-D-glucopyranoside ligase